MALYRDWYDQSMPRRTDPAAIWTTTSSDPTLKFGQRCDSWAEAMKYAAKVAVNPTARKPRVSRVNGKWRVTWRQALITYNSAV